MTPDTSTRCPLIHIPEAELADWYEIGWAYIEHSPKSNFAERQYVVMEWQSKRPPVMPFKENAI